MLKYSAMARITISQTTWLMSTLLQNLQLTCTLQKQSMSRSIVNVTDIIEFDIVAYNTGPCDAINVNVSEVLSSHLKLINNITEKLIFRC